MNKKQLKKAIPIVYAIPRTRQISLAKNKEAREWLFGAIMTLAEEEQFSQKMQLGKKKARLRKQK